MVKLHRVPTYEELNDYYGNPEIEPGVPTPGFIEAPRFIKVRMPFYMVLSWAPEQKVYNLFIHSKIVHATLDALDEIKEYGGEKWLHERKYDRFGGCYNYRAIRGGTKLSTHSWGISIDLNPHLAPYKGKSNQPAFIKDAFLKRGFYSFTFDGMHFQAVKSDHPRAIYKGR